MKIVEQFIEGKKGEASVCEDGIAVTPHFLALIDGATSRLGKTLRGISTGRFAMETLSAALNDLPPASTAREGIDFLTLALKTATETQGKAEGQDVSAPPFPAAALLIYSAARQEIWRVADSSFFVNGVAHETMFKLEEAAATMRHILIEGRFLRGASLADIQEHDSFQDIMTRINHDWRAFVNQDHPYGFGVMDGTPVPSVHIGVFPVAGAQEIAFASDGYPRIFGSLAETEAYLQSVITQDPLMHRLHPQVKGVAKDQRSYDDRSYVRFLP